MAWCKLSELRFSTVPTDPVNPLMVYTRRCYNSPTEVVYDYHVGHELLVRQKSSAFHNNRISVLDTRTLQVYGYTELHVHFNDDHPHVVIPLEELSCH